MNPQELVLQKNWITSDQLKAAQALQKKGDSRRIELILLDQNWIDQAQMMELLTETFTKLPTSNPEENDLVEDVFLAQMSWKKKWLSKKIASRIFRYALELRSEGRSRRFLDLALFEGILKEEQRNALEEELSLTLFLCPSCGCKIPIGKVQKGIKFKCPQCQGVYQNTKKSSTGSVRAIQTDLHIASIAFRDPMEETPEKSRYEARKTIGQGGIGTIYQLYDHDLERLVALKAIRQDRNFAEKGLLRFIKEARILARLEHPNIVPVHELGYTSDGRPYFTMKYVRGVALSEVMENLRKGDSTALEEYPLEKLVQLFLPVCQAMIFAHAHGVIHRDLKPANIMLGPFGEVLVMDWGLAKLKEEDEKKQSPYGDMIDVEGNTQETSEGKMLGTVHYIPPEQVFNRPGEVDERSDIYSLGAILYEILTFWPPFVGKEKNDLIQDVLSKNPPKPASITKRKVPYELEAICFKALSKEKNLRYPTVLGLYEDVVNYVSNRPVLAAPSGPLSRLVKMLKRNKVLLIALLVIFAVILVLSPLFGLATKAAMIGAAVIAAAVYAFVFYDEARRKVVEMERRLKSSETARRQLEVQVVELESGKPKEEKKEG